MSRISWLTTRRGYYIGAIAFSVATATAIFQNCSGTGNNSGLNSSVGQINKSLALKPNPVDLSINQISYMSCPSNNLNLSNPDPLAQAFYRIRFGAYDNSTANGFASGVNIAGLSLNTAGMNYLKTISSAPNASMISNYITSSPYTGGSQPVAALINKTRSVQSLAYTAMATPLLAPFNNAALISNLAAQGTSKVNYIQELGTYQGALVGNLNQNSVSENQLRINLGTQLLFVGMSPSTSAGDPTTITQSLIGPDSDPTQRLYGMGYNLGFSNNILSIVNEFSLETSKTGSPVASTWNYFSLKIVRELDRTYTTVGSLVTYNSPLKGGASVTLHANDVVYPGEEYLIPGSITLTKNYFNNNEATVIANLTASYITGAGVLPKNIQNFASCPTEDSSQLTGVLAEQLRVARRFLPPGNWEINMTKGCAVPTSNATGSGETCYNNDTNAAALIDYTGIPGTNCRIDQTTANLQDCAARISFSWKK